MYKKEIINKLKDIEKEKNIKVLFCIESGSRAWNLDSKDSDYDIRFVYSRPAKEYLSINTPSDTIRLAYDKEGNPCPQEGSFFDFEGKDVIKFARLLFNSNPTVLEWLKSDIVYLGKKPKEFVEFAENNMKPISLFYHYKSMCKQNYLKYLKANNDVTYKRYLYAMRGLVNAKWVGMTEVMPPMDFVEILQRFSYDNNYDVTGTNLDENIITMLLEIIKMKKQAKEKDIIKRIPHIDSYIESFLKNDIDAPSHNKQTIKTDSLNKAIQRLIIPEWRVEIPEERDI